MEEELKILEEFNKNGYSMLLMKYGDRNKANLKLERAIENILKRYKELEEYYEEQNEVNAKFIPTSVIQKRMKKYKKMIEEKPYDKPIIEIHLRELQEILEEGRR